MAKYFKENSPVHLKFEELFKLMEKYDVSQNYLGSYTNFTVTYIDENKQRKEVKVEIVDSETDERILYFSPTFDYRVKIIED